MDSLEGSIFVLFADANGQFDILGNTIDEMNSSRWALDFAEMAKSLYEKSFKLVMDKADLRVDFRVWRDGEVSMPSPIIRDETLRANSDLYAAERGAKFDKWIAEQAYFFLRDVCHVHQHHAPNVDTIMTLQDFDRGTSNWRNNILYSLQNYVIRVRRSGRNEDLHRARGILAYAKSFHAVCETRQKSGGMSVFNYEAICESIEAKIAENDFHDLQDVNIRNWAVADSVGFRNILIAFLGVLTAVWIVIMQPFMLKNASYWEAAGQKIWSYKTQIGAPLLAIISAFWYYSEESVIRRRLYRKSAFIRDLKAITILRWKIFGVLALCLSALLILATVYLLN